MGDRIFVLDFGGQYAHPIANRVRRLNVLAEIKDPTTPLNELRKAKGLILSGGPASVLEKGAPQHRWTWAGLLAAGLVLVLVALGRTI